MISLIEVAVIDLNEIVNQQQRKSLYCGQLVAIWAFSYENLDTNGIMQYQISEWTRIANSDVVSSGVQLGLQNEETDDLLTLYAYDAFDRLIKIEQGSDVIENTYTADGKKLSRTTNGVLTYYVYDGNVVIEEQNSENKKIGHLPDFFYL